MTNEQGVPTPGAAPMLSIIVVIVSDTVTPRANTAILEPCLDALAVQQEAPTHEIIVPYHERTDGIPSLRQKYPNVRFLPVSHVATLREGGGGREHHDELRSCGLREARGSLIALLEDQGHPEPRWAARVVAAHEARHAAIGGAIENGVDRPLNWAVYFCDFNLYQNPVPAGPSARASDAHVTYKATALQAIRPTWEHRFHETMVHAALHARHETIALDPALVVFQRRVGLTFGNAVRERFIWGRSYAATRTRLMPGSARLMMALFSPALPLLLVSRMARNVRRKGTHGGAFARALPYTLLLSTAWAAGEFAGYVTKRTSSGVAA